VQCLYYNAFLLLGICAGAAAVFVQRRAYNAFAVVVGIGGLAALSLLIYLPTIQKVGSTNFFWKVDFTAALFWNKLSETLGSPFAAGTWIWLAVFLVAVVGGGWAISRRVGEKEPLPSSREALLFALVTLVVGSAAYFAFLFHLSYMTQPWYYVVFIVFAAICLEIIVASVWRSSWGLRSAFALVFIGLAAQPAWAALELRQTNVDTIAAHLEKTATENDLIVINTWNYGITFRRYYHGAARCATVPPIADLRSHRMDLVNRQVNSVAPMAPVLHEMEETLRRGHTIWVIGSLHFVAPGRAPLQTTPGARNFYRAWSEQAAFVVQSHATEAGRIKVAPDHPAMHYEQLPLTAFKGWREPGQVSANADPVVPVPQQ
jgi:hypothetical protein